MSKFNSNKGISILGIIFFGFIIIMVLSYFNINIRSVAENPTTQENINYVRGETKSFWTTYLAEPASYLWNDIWVDIFWATFVSNMERIRDGKPTDLDDASKDIQVEQE